MARKLLVKRSGESLVELAISIAVLSLIVLWAMSAFGAYTKTGQDLDSVGQAIALADSTIETLKTYSLTQLNPIPPLPPDWPASGATGVLTEFASPNNNLQYQYKRSTDKVSGSFTLIEVTMTVFDKTTGNSVYVVKTSFLRDAGGLNVGD
jgi:type II secretory pathway pseudopilin PulG